MTTRNKMTGLGPKEVELIAAVTGHGMRVFTVAEAAKILGLTHPVVSKLVHQLSRKRKLQPIEKGRYLVIPPEAWTAGEYAEEGVILASQLVKPYALAYWTALSFYGWTEQVSRTLFVQTIRLKRPVELKAMTIRFVKLRPHRFFGTREHWVGAQKVVVTDKEKTIVDCLDQPRYCGEIVEAVKGIWNARKELDKERLLEYALRMNNGAIIKRLGFLAESLNVFDRRFRARLKGHVTPSFVPLDTGRGNRGTYNTDWYVRVNVTPDTLTEWMTH